MHSRRIYDEDGENPRPPPQKHPQTTPMIPELRGVFGCLVLCPQNFNGMSFEKIFRLSIVLVDCDLDSGSYASYLQYVDKKIRLFLVNGLTRSLMQGCRVFYGVRGGRFCV